MPNVIVTCIYNPPTISIVGAQLKQEVLCALERNLPLCTTTSQNSLSIAKGQEPKFVPSDRQANTWTMDLGQHYSDQLSSCFVGKEIIGALQSEGWALRATSGITRPDDEKNVERFFFSRSR